jgi:hypothetical protein
MRLGLREPQCPKCQNGTWAAAPVKRFQAGYDLSKGRGCLTSRGRMESRMRKYPCPTHPNRALSPCTPSRTAFHRIGCTDQRIGVFALPSQLDSRMASCDTAGPRSHDQTSETEWYAVEFRTGIMACMQVHRILVSPRKIYYYGSRVSAGLGGCWKGNDEAVSVNEL